MDPYGFIGKFQALSCTWSCAATDLVRLLIKNEKMVDAYINAIERCSSYDQANALSEILPQIGKISEHQADRLVRNHNENGQVRESYGFNGSYPNKFGDGLVIHLSRIVGKKYHALRNGKIELSS